MLLGRNNQLSLAENVPDSRFGASMYSKFQQPWWKEKQAYDKNKQTNKPSSSEVRSHLLLGRPDLNFIIAILFLRFKIRTRFIFSITSPSSFFDFDLGLVEELAEVFGLGFALVVVFAFLASLVIAISPLASEAVFKLAPELRKNLNHYHWEIQNRSQML